MKKKLLAFFLAVCLCTACLPLAASAAPPAWSTAYKDFILSGRYVNAFQYETVVSEPWGSGEKRAMLLDMDQDDTPELLISNGDASQLGRASYIFTYTGGQVAYIGNGPEYPVYYPGTAFPGITGDYAPDGGAGTHTLSYRWKDGNTMQREPVYSCDMDGNHVVQLTGDDELFRVCRAGGKSLYEQGVNIAALGDAGWDAFVDNLFPGTPPDEPPVRPSFTDVPAGAFYAAPVAWAVESGITNGTAPQQFSPGGACTRGQIVTFLWRAAGEPQPASSHNPFTDVKPSDYFYDAVLWAVENQVTTGAAPNRFDPNGTCTRGQAVTFLWRAAGKPGTTLAYDPFKDVATGEYYHDAVLWAAESGITAGISNREFGPGSRCSRGQIVTFLYRRYVEPAHVELPVPEEEVYKSVTRGLPGYAQTAQFDVDGDATDELLVYYGESMQRHDIAFSLYTIQDGSAVPVVQERTLQAIASAPSGGIGVVEKAGKRYLYTCGRNYGRTTSHENYFGTLRLYTLDGTELAMAEEIEYTIRVRDTSGTPYESTINHRVNGRETALSYSAYRSWVDSLKWDVSLGDVKGRANAYF